MSKQVITSLAFKHAKDVILAKARHAVKLQRYPERNWMPDQSLPSIPVKLRTGSIGRPA
jgi:hypothetical protein